MPHADRFAVFATTAGPSRGFGHLMRCGVLADALGVGRVAVLRSVSRDTRRAARRLGWTLHVWRDVAGERTPDLVVVDDPSEAQTVAWVRRARRAGIPVAAIHDGRSRHAAADVVIDGSAIHRHDERAGRLLGPAFAVLRPRRDLTVATPRPRVLIALGGGAHVRRSGAALAAAIVRLMPHVEVELAAGFTHGSRPAVPAGCRWVEARDGLAPLFSRASLAIVSGGVTLYEACAAGIPAIAVPVVPAQQPAIDALARQRAVVDASLDGPHGPARVAAIACWLMRQPVLRRLLRRHGQRLVDGRGTARVTARLNALIHRHRGNTSHAVA